MHNCLSFTCNQSKHLYSRNYEDHAGVKCTIVAEVQGIGTAINSATNTPIKMGLEHCVSNQSPVLSKTAILRSVFLEKGFTATTYILLPKKMVFPYGY